MRLFLWGFLLIILPTGAMRAQTRRIQHIDPEQSPALGLGYQAEADELRQPCVSGDRSFVNRPEATIGFESALTQDQLDEEITGKFSGGINVFIASAKITNKLSSLVNDDSYRRRLVYKASFRSKLETLANPKVNALGTRLIGLGDASLSIANCGREYVESIEHGGEIFIALDFDFASRDVMNEINTRVEFSILGIKKVKEFSKTIHKFKSSVRMSVDAFQIGGQPAKLQQILNQYPSKNCRIDAIDRCDELIQKLLDYATAEDQFPAQIQDNSPIAYTTAAYNSRGLGKLVATASPMMKAEQQLAYEDMISWYRREDKKLQKIAELVASPLVSTRQRNQLYFARDTVDQNVSKALKALAGCEASPGACPSERDRLQPALAPIDETLLTAWRGFYFYCQRNSPEQAAGLAAILRTLQTPDCEAAEAKVSSLRQLDLHGLQLTDLDFLSTVTNLEQLDVSRNLLGQLYGISGLTHLKSLKASRNEIDSLAGLRNSRSLQNLHVSRNQITTLEPLARLSGIQFLSCYENLLNEEEVKGILPQTRKLLSVQDACDDETDKLVNARRIDRESADIYKELGFGPSFAANGTVTWLNCDLASITYE